MGSITRYQLWKNIFSSWKTPNINLQLIGVCLNEISIYISQFVLQRLSKVTKTEHQYVFLNLFSANKCCMCTVHLSFPNAFKETTTQQRDLTIPNLINMNFISLQSLSAFMTFHHFHTPQQLKNSHLIHQKLVAQLTKERKKTLVISHLKLEINT